MGCGLDPHLLGFFLVHTTVEGRDGDSSVPCSGLILRATRQDAVRRVKRDLRFCGGNRKEMGGMQSRVKVPSERLSLENFRSPAMTWISTPGWLAEAVE